MFDIYELNRRRAEALVLVQALGLANTPFTLEGRVKADAQYRLAQDAWLAAEREYRRAIDGLSAEELRELVKETERE